MLCKKCIEQFGPSYRHLSGIVKAYETNDKGMQGAQHKILKVLGHSELDIARLQKEIQGLNDRIQKLEEKK